MRDLPDFHRSEVNTVHSIGPACVHQRAPSHAEWWAVSGHRHKLSPNPVHERGRSQCQVVQSPSYTAGVRWEGEVGGVRWEGEVGGVRWEGEVGG